MTLFSIIIPVYNVEKYIDQCIQSVLSQSFQDIEIILVNDGSTDNSSWICDKYAEKDDRIRVIHKVNEGPAMARNVGIDCARGQYIMFLDSDDFWCQGYLAEVVKKLEENPEVDVICTKYIKYYGQEVNHIPLNVDQMAIKDRGAQAVFAYMLAKNLYECGTCATIVKQGLLKENNLRFSNFKFCEDIDLTPRIILAAKKVDLLANVYYCYRQYVNFKAKEDLLDQKVHDLWEIIKGWDLKLINEVYDEEFIREYRNYLSYQLAILLAMLSGINKVKRNNILDELKDNIHILNYAIRGKSKWVLILYKCTGLRATCSMLSLFIKYKRWVLIGKVN